MPGAARSASAAALLVPVLLLPPPPPPRSGAWPHPAARRMRPSPNALRIAVLLLLGLYSTISVEKSQDRCPSALRLLSFVLCSHFEGAPRDACYDPLHLRTACMESSSGQFPRPTGYELYELSEPFAAAAVALASGESAC